MNPVNIAILEKHRHHWERFKLSQAISGMGMDVKGEVLDVIKKEWSPGYSTTLWCGDCVADMLKYAYTQYDKYLKDADKNRV